MHRYTKNTILTLVNYIPLKLKKGIVRALAKDEVFSRQYGREAISAFSASCGITGLMANGVCGSIISAPNDFVVHQAYAQNGEWASTTTKIFNDFFEEHGGTGVFFDIGANIGMTTIPIAQKFPRVRCFSFEPEPTNFGNLVKNLRINSTDGSCELFQVALFREQTNIEFEIADGNLGDHRLKTSTDKLGQENEHLRKTIKVKAMPLDYFVDNIAPNFAVKIDVQGAEPFVFQGGEKVLSQADLVVMEWCPYMIERLGGDIDVILDFIVSHFRVCEIHPAEGTGHKSSFAINEAVALLEKEFIIDKLNPKIYCDLVLRK